ncbi:hypothetical protein D3C71_1988880 [compost metagenome]
MKTHVGLPRGFFNAMRKGTGRDRILLNSLVLAHFQCVLLIESYCEGELPCADFREFTDGASRTP